MKNLLNTTIILFLLFLAGSLNVTANEEHCNMAQNHFELANQYLNEANFIRAITLYTCVLDTDASSVEAHFYRAISYFNLNYFDLALTDLDISISLDNENPNAYATRAYIYQLKGNYQLALTDYHSAINEWTSDSNVVLSTLYLRYGSTLFQLDDVQQAIDIYNSLIESQPDYALAYLYRGIAYNALNVNNQFQSDIEIALSTDSTVIRQYLSEVYLYTEADNFAAAHEIADNSILISPDDFQPYFEQGFIYFSEGLYEDAIQEFTTTIELNSSMLRAYQFRGLAHHYLGETELGLQDIGLALNELPTMYSAYNARAIIYYDSGNIDLATNDYLESISIFPNQLLPYLELGNLYFEDGDLENSLSYYNLYVALAECTAISDALEQITTIENILNE